MQLSDWTLHINNVIFFLRKNERVLIYNEYFYTIRGSLS